MGSRLPLKNGEVDNSRHMKPDNGANVGCAVAAMMGTTSALLLRCMNVMFCEESPGLEEEEGTSEPEGTGSDQDSKDTESIEGEETCKDLLDDDHQDWAMSACWKANRFDINPLKGNLGDSMMLVEVAWSSDATSCDWPEVTRDGGPVVNQFP